MSRIHILVSLILIVSLGSCQNTQGMSERTPQDHLNEVKVTCEVCKALEHELIEKIDLIDKDLPTLELLICPLVAHEAKMSIKDCHDLLNLLEPVVFMNLMRLLVAREDLICGSVLKVCDSPDISIFDLKGWIKNMLKDTRTINTKKVPTGSKGTYTVLQVNDMHFDNNYKEGGEAFCENNLICCRADSKTPLGKKKTPSGRFGMIGNCDLPERTIDDFFKFVEDKVKPDVIMWLGDNEYHEIEKMTKEINIDLSTRLANKFQSYISKNKADIWLSIGNHETYPIDHFDHMTSNTQWLLDGLSNAYSPLLGPQSTAQLKQKGFYSKSIPERNLKIISLLCNTYDAFNFFNIMKTFDPLGQLAWLAKELKKSEDNNEDVIIMSHIPIGDETSIAVWTDAYNAIVDRFQNTVTASFSAHTHDDHFKFHQSHSDPSKVVLVDFVGPSLTTYSYHNPSFRVFKMDSETNQVIDYTQYRLDIEHWNKQPESASAQWEEVYTWSKLYGYPNAGMPSVQDWRNKMVAGDKDFMINFWQNKQASFVKITDVTKEQIEYAKCDVLGDARLRYHCLKNANLPVEASAVLGNLMDFYITLN